MRHGLAIWILIAALAVAGPVPAQAAGLLQHRAGNVGGHHSLGYFGHGESSESGAGAQVHDPRVGVPVWVGGQLAQLQQTGVADVDLADSVLCGLGAEHPLGQPALFYFCGVLGHIESKTPGNMMKDSRAE